MSTRERILDALEETIGESGPSGTTLEAVAQRAGVSKGGLLYHFASKEALYSGLLERLTATSDEELAAWRAAPEGPVAAYLASSTVAEDAHTRTLMAVLRLVGSREVDVEPSLVAAFESWFTELRRHVSDPVLARLVHVVGDGLYLHALVGAQDPALDVAVIERLLAIVAQQERRA